MGEVRKFALDEAWKLLQLATATVVQVIESIGNEFSKMLNLYPVVPYLDSKESLIRWTHFIHNKINEKLEKPTISLEEFYTLYYHQYKPKKVHWTEHMRLRKKIIYVVFIVFLIGLLIYFYTQK